MYVRNAMEGMEAAIPRQALQRLARAEAQQRQRSYDLAIPEYEGVFEWLEQQGGMCYAAAHYGRELLNSPEFAAQQEEQRNAARQLVKRNLLDAAPEHRKRQCACGCEEWFVSGRSDQKYLDSAHRQAAHRKRRRNG